MDITVAGTDDSIVMVEGEAHEISEQEMLDALAFAHEYIRQMCAIQTALAKEVGAQKRLALRRRSQTTLKAEVEALAGERTRELAATPLLKEERAEQTATIQKEVLAALAEKYPEMTRRHQGDAA